MRFLICMDLITSHGIFSNDYVFQISLGAAIITAGAQLVELDLSDNAFGPTGVNGIVELLKSKSCYSLKELRLNNNGLGSGGGKVSMKAGLYCCFVSYTSFK